MKKGDIIEIPLPDKTKAFFRYLESDKFGKLIEVYDYRVKAGESVDVQSLPSHTLLFAPVFVRLTDAVLSRLSWRKVGNIPVKDFIFPEFVTAHIAPSGHVMSWSIYNGASRLNVGKNLTSSQKKLEIYGSYPADSIITRIMTGEKPMQKLIETNFFDFHARS